MALGTIISLLTLLANLGIQGGKAAAQNSEDEKSKSRDLEMQVEEKKLKEKQRAKARQDAIARAIGSDVGTMPSYYDAKINPYEQKDLSGYDVARGVVGEVGNLAAGAAGNSGTPTTENMDGLSTSADVATDFPGGGVDTSGASTRNLAKTPDSMVQPDRYNRYGSYLSKRRA